MTRHFLKLFLLLLFISSPGPLFAQQPSIIDEMLRLKPSLVEVTGIRSGIVGKSNGRVRVAEIENRGAGVIIHPSGIIVTNAHVVDHAGHIKVLFHDGTQRGAQVLKFASALDLSLLKVEAPSPLPAVAIADSAAIKLNDEIFTVGNSPLLKEAITGGRITGLASSRNGAYSNSYESDFFQTTLDLYSGDSGGPLFNKNAQLIGLVSAKLISQGHASFAVSSNKIARYLTVCLKEAQQKQ